mgnify:FL=1
MSGHRHWSKIKHKKTAADERKGQVFSKLAREITVAAREKGPDPNFNPRLRLVIERAKSLRLPSENIERAIKKGAGDSGGEKLEEVIFEAFGPGSIAIIIEGITDNKNRTLGEIKQTLSQHNAKLVGEGGVRWMFERKINPDLSVLEWVPKQEIELDEKTKESCEKLFEILDENEAVQEIYSNLKV